MPPPTPHKPVMTKAGTPHAMASVPSQSGACRPMGPRTGSRALLSRPFCASKTQVHMIAMPTPASTPGRYQTLRKMPMPRTGLLMSMAAHSAAVWPTGTPMRTK
jgi:hypothetical protein